MVIRDMVKTPVFRTAYDDPYVHKGLDCSGDPVLTIQSEKENCDINVIVERFEKTGVLPSMTSSPFYGDFSVPFDFQEAQQILINAENAFMQLPAKVRREFDNNPAKFLAFVDDPSNADALVSMGLREAPSEKPEASPITENPKGSPAA